MFRHTGFFSRNRNNLNEVILCKKKDIPLILPCTFRTASSSWFCTFYLDNRGIKRWNFFLLFYCPESNCLLLPEHNFGSLRFCKPWISSIMYISYLVQFVLCKKPLEIFNRTSITWFVWGDFFLNFFFFFSVANKADIFDETVGHFFSHV